MTIWVGKAMPWNYGDLLEAVSNTVAADAPAFAHGEKVMSWGEARPRMNNLARALIGARREAARQGRVLSAQRGPNTPRALGACFLGAADPRQRQLPLHAGRGALHPRQFRRPDADLRARIPRRGGADPQPAPQGEDLRRGRTAARSAPFARDLRDAGDARATARRSASNARRTISSSSTPAARPACPRA